MIVATAAALYFASGQTSILDLLVFVGALWGALVFPVIASFYWEKVTNKAFTVSVLAALATFLPVRFGWLPMDGAVGIVFDVISVIGIGVVLGLMAFGFFGLRWAEDYCCRRRHHLRPLRGRQPARVLRAQRFAGRLRGQHRGLLT